MLELIILVISIVTNFIIGLFVLFKNPRSLTNRLFALLSVSLIGWTIANYISINTQSYSQIFDAVLVVFLFVILQNTSYLLLIANFPHKRLSIPKAPVLVYLGLSILTVAMLFSGYIFKGYEISSNSINLVPNIGMPLFILQATISIFGGLYLLLRRIKKSTGNLRQQYRLLFYSSVFLLVFIPLTNFILPLLLNETFFVVFSPLYTLVFAALIGYAIIAQKLFDIRAVVARAVAFGVVVLIIGLIYGFGAFWLIHVIVFGSQQALALAEQISYVVLAIVLAFTFGPILRVVERLTDRVFYRDKYDPQKFVNRIGWIMAGEIRLEELCQKVISEIKTTMKISEVNIVVFGDDKLHFQTKLFGNERHEILANDLKKLGRLITIADELSGGEKKAILEKYGFSISLSLRTSDKLLGYILLGEKKSGDIYSTADVRTLKIIANELSVAAQNAKAFTEIQQFNLTLQEKIDRATKSLRQANCQLKELDEAKDEFISMASHQLRTPLTTVKGYVSMLDEGDFGKLTKEQKQSVGLALDGSNRMARLIDDLLNISRMEAGKFYIDAKKVDLSKIVAQEIESLRNFAVAKNVHIKYHHLKTAIPILMLDENKTRQVIMNLIDNAINYSQPPKGGAKVEISLEHIGSSIFFIVKDNGIGVPADQQTQLFTKMFRARNAKEMRPDGTGLGLFLVKKVVKDQGGKIIFESKPGQGSSFGFEIPIHNSIKHDKSAEAKLKAQSNSAPGLYN